MRNSIIGGSNSRQNPFDEFLAELQGKIKSSRENMSKPESKTRRGRKKTENNTANLGFEAELWEAANALRGSMDAAEYKHVVLGLIFLKYISDAFEKHRKRLEQEPYADPEDPDEYRAANVF